MNIERWKLKPENLTTFVDESKLQFESTDELPALDRIIGQDRAVSALDFGTQIDGFGYNLYVLGPPGSGRASAVKLALEARAKERPPSDDWCYVNNFQEKHKPVALRLPAGRGRGLRDDMQELIKELATQLPQAFDGEHYRNQRDKINQQLQQVQSQEFAHLQKEARQKGFTLQQAGSMFGIIPLVNDEPINPENYEQLSEEQKREIEEKGKGLRDDLNAAVKRVRDAEKEAKLGVEELDRRVADLAVGHIIEELRTKYAQYSRVVQYLNDVQNDIVENVQEFLQAGQQDQAQMMFGMRMPRPRATYTTGTP